MNPRDQILGAVRDALLRTRPELEAMARSAPHEPPPFVHAPQPNLADQFAAELERLQGRAHRCATEGAALEIIGRVLEKHAAQSVLAWDERDIGLAGFDAWLQSRGVVRADARLKPCATDADGGATDAPVAQGTDSPVAQGTNSPVAQGPNSPVAQGPNSPVAQGFSPADRKAQLQAIEPTPVGITGADVAIAESGSVILAGGSGRPRLASLITPAHIAVVRSSQLVRGLGEALVRLREMHGTTIFDAASSLTFITGPSRTADIELTLTLGVHGPREVHVIVVG